MDSGLLFVRILITILFISTVVYTWKEEASIWKMPGFLVMCMLVTNGFQVFKFNPGSGDLFVWIFIIVLVFILACRWWWMTPPDKPLGEKIPMWIGIYTLTTPAALLLIILLPVINTIYIAKLLTYGSFIGILILFVITRRIKLR